VSRPPRFFVFLLAVMGSMTGLVLSGNLIQLAFFWELTSLRRALMNAPFRTAHGIVPAHDRSHRFA